MKHFDKIVVAGLVSSIIFSTSSVYAKQKTTYESSDGVHVGARVTYRYLPDSMFRVKAKIGYVTDIELKQGEVVTYIAGGDTSRWLIDKAMVSNIQHVYLKPIEKDIKTNVIINTNLHSYRIEVVSGDEYDPLVTFKFDETNSPVSGNKNYSSFGNEMRSGRRNYNYRIKAKKNVDITLMPQEIFDDGMKTYIKMRRENKYDLPVIYTLDPWDGKTLSMVNYRVQGDYFVVDRVIEHGRLYFHQKFYIDFNNEGISKKKIKEYRQRDTMVGRMRKAWDDGREELNEGWVRARDDVRREVDALNEKSSDRKKGIRVYSEEDMERSVYGREQELERLRNVNSDMDGYRDEDFDKRQMEYKLREEKRLAREAKEREAAQQELVRQEALRRQEEKRQAQLAKERIRQAEAQRILLEKQRAEEARRQKKLQENIQKREAEIQRLNEAQMKLRNEIRDLQATGSISKKSDGIG